MSRFSYLASWQREALQTSLENLARCSDSRITGIHPKIDAYDPQNVTIEWTARTVLTHDEYRDIFSAALAGTTVNKKQA